MAHGALNIVQFFWLMLIAFVVAIAVRRVRIPYALALVITGLVIGAPRLLPLPQLDSTVVMYVFLPPLLFEAAINLRTSALRREWKPIAIYTLAGTVLSAFIVGWIVHLLLHLPLAVALVFGALISTTDPISVISIFRRVGASKRLTLVLEAESLFNNDIAVVLFTVFTGMMGAVHGGSGSALHGIEQFCVLSVGGALLGTAIGLIASRIHNTIDDNLVEIMLTTVVAFGSYMCADRIHVSPVMAVIAAGLVIGNVGMPASMSAGTRLAVAATWEYAVFVVNSIVFLLIGIEVSYINWTAKLGLVAFAIVAVLAGRAAIYPLSFLVNRLGGRIPRAWQHALYWGGLRGALSMALALGLRGGFPYREELVVATFGVVLFSLLVQGLTLAPLSRKLGLTGVAAPPSPDAHPDEVKRLSGEMVAVRAALLELQRLRESEEQADWAVELLTQDYRHRLSELKMEMAAAAPEHTVHRARRESDVRRQVILAQKSALRDAEKEGLLDEDDWRRIVARVDAELVALTTEDWLDGATHDA